MNWQPIETAPKDRRILLYYGWSVCGCWNLDEFINNPKPYWLTDKGFLGKTWHKENNPTHWAELIPPEAE